MPAVSASRPGWPKEQSILRTGSGIHSLRLRKECAVHSGVILLDTGICNVDGIFKWNRKRCRFYWIGKRKE